jgi:hypothetical protein
MRCSKRYNARACEGVVGRVPTGTIGVRLAQDVLEALLARAETEGTDLDRLVNPLWRNQLIPDDE